MLNLTANELFTGTYSNGGYTTDNNDGSVLAGNRGGRATVGLNYKSSDKSFLFDRSDFVSGKFLPSQIVNDPDQRFIVYERGPGDRMLMYRPGAGNPEIQMTYASYMLVEQVFTGTVDVGTNLTYYHWGIPTKVMPRTGSANYTGIINGRGISNANVYVLSGTSALNVNFQNQSLTGTLSPFGTLLSGGSRRSFGRFGFDAIIDSQTSRFIGNVDFNTYLGSAFIEGGFYGPNAAEYSAVFGGIDIDDPLATGNILTLFGATVGKKN